MLPEKTDPDDLLRRSGPAAVREVIEAALPMVQLLWRRETEGRIFDSPERKAALDKDLRTRIALIRDASIRRHYADEIKNLRWALFRPARPGGQPGKRWPPNAPQPPRAGTKTSMLAGADEAQQTHLRQAVILATAIATPAVISEFETGIERMECADPDLVRLRDLVLRHGLGKAAALKQLIVDTLGAEALEKLHALRHVAISPGVRNPGDLDLARLTLEHEIAKLEAQRGLTTELAEATEDIVVAEDEAVTWRLGQAAEARNRATRSLQEDRTEYDLGENGARINREERSAFDALLGQIDYSKRRK
jgi:DNA primase